MAKDKKSKASDIEKLRMILDSPSDPKLQKILDKHEKNLKSIRQRLSDEPSTEKEDYTSRDYLKKYDTDNLEPRVVIHDTEDIETAETDVQISTSDTKKAIDEFKDEKVNDDLDDLFENEELFEVEKVDVLQNEFLEVKPKEVEKTAEEDEEKIFVQITTEKNSTDREDESIPEWEPVKDDEEPVFKEFTEIKTIEKEDEIEKFEVKKEEEEDLKTEEFTEVKPIDETEEIKESSDEDKDASTELEFKEVETIEKEDEIEKFETKDDKNETIEEFTEINPTEEEIKDEKIEEKEISEEKFTVVAPNEKGLESEESNVESGKSGEEIQTWEPIKLDSDSKEIEPEKTGEIPPLKKPEEEITKKKGFKKFVIVKKRFGDKEERNKRKEEKKLKKLEIKEAKMKSKEKELEIKKSKDEKNRMLFTKEQELKQKEKEEQKQKKIKTKKDQKRISKLVADDDGYQTEAIPISELKAQKIKSKQEQKEQEAKMKAQLKEDKKLEAIREKEIKKQEKKQKKEEKLKKVEIKTPELVSDEQLPITKKEDFSEKTEWESYDVEEITHDEKNNTQNFYVHGDFTLFKKEIKTVTGKKRVVHFFSKKKPEVGEPVQLPEGYEVKVNKRTELPYLKKKN